MDLCPSVPLVLPLVRQTKPDSVPPTKRLLLCAPLHTVQKYYSDSPDTLFGLFSFHFHLLYQSLAYPLVSLSGVRHLPFCTLYLRGRPHQHQVDQTLWTHLTSERSLI
jgi:hypothetical protein